MFLRLVLIKLSLGAGASRDVGTANVWFGAFLFFSPQGTPQKDVVIKADAPSTLLSEKHAEYIASYGTKKDDYVGASSFLYISCLIESDNHPYLIAKG